MMGSMNKRMNSLSNRDLFAKEKGEHNLKRTPTLGQLLRNEIKEHNLKGVPSLGNVRRAEALEHGGAGRK